MARKQTLIHLHGSTRLADASLLNKGEIAVTHATTKADTELAVKTTVDGTDVLVYIPSLDKVTGAIATAKGEVDTAAKGYADAAQSAAEATAKSYTDGVKTDLQGQIDDIEELVGTTDVAEQIQAAVAVETKAREDADTAIREDFAAADAALKTELQGYADTAEADALTAAKAYADGLAKNYDAKGSAAQALTDAKAYADGLASNYDAAGSAADALADAKEYADGLNTTMDGRVKELEADTHTHANKAELDKIADGDKAKWDAATNRINTFMDSEEIAGTVDTLHEINNWMTTAGANATDLSKAIADEETARRAADEKIREDFATADATTLSSAKDDATTKANTAEANAKAYADDLAKNYDAAGSAADALADAKEYADGLNTTMDGRVDALEAKFGTGEGSVSDQIADAITAEVTRSNKYTDDAITAEVTRSNNYADQAETDAIAAAKTYTDTRETAITTAFTKAINNAIAGIDLKDSGTGENTGIDVTVEIVDGKTMTVTVDDSNLVIDCGEY